MPSRCPRPGGAVIHSQGWPPLGNEYKLYHVLILSPRRGGRSPLGRGPPSPLRGEPHSFISVFVRSQGLAPLATDRRPSGAWMRPSAPPDRGPRRKPSSGLRPGKGSPCHPPSRLRPAAAEVDRDLQAVDLLAVAAEAEVVEEVGQAGLGGHL